MLTIGAVHDFAHLQEHWRSIFSVTVVVMFWRADSLTAEDPVRQIGVRESSQRLESPECRLSRVVRESSGERAENEVAFLAFPAMPEPKKTGACGGYPDVFAIPSAGGVECFSSFLGFHEEPLLRRLQKMARSPVRAAW